MPPEATNTTDTPAATITAPAPSEPVHVEPIKPVEVAPIVAETAIEQELELLHKIEADVEKSEPAAAPKDAPTAEEPAPIEEPPATPAEEPPFLATEFVTATENGNHHRVVVAGGKGACIPPPADPRFPRFISVTELHPFDTKAERDKALT